MIEHVDLERCDGCGTCVTVCPADVFRLHPETGQALIVYGADCQTCFCCELDCPEQAITVGAFRMDRVQAW